MSSKRTLVGLGLVITASCTFGTSRTIITSGTIASVPAVAANTDSDIMFIGDATGRMAQADPATGAIQGSVVLWGGVASTPVAITPDGEDTSQVWALHADGYLVNWQDGPTYATWHYPPPLGNGVARTYCDLDHTDEGDFYVSTVDDGISVLSRRDGNTGVWSSIDIGDDEGICMRVAHDLYHDELYVLREGFNFEHRQVGSMALLSSVLLDADGGALADVDVWGNAVVGAGTTEGPILPGGGYQPSPRLAWTYDVTNGNTLDAKIITGGAPSSVHITINAAASKPEMLIGTSNGSPTVRGILLEN